MIKYIFFGTPEFATIILDRLIKAGLSPMAVVTNPDRPAGRNKIITPPPVKQLITGKRLQIDILQPDEFNQPFAQKIENYNADVFVLAAYGKILPKWLIEMPPRGIIGVHPSLLPKYRGATPIQSVILADEKETGTTLFLMDEQVDHGQILASSSLLITDADNYESLSKKLAELSADLLIETLPEYLNKKIAPHTQNEDEAIYTKKLKTEDGFVDLEKDNPKEIELKVRALNPEPGVWTMKDGRRMKIMDVDLTNGRLVLKKIQYEGKNPQLVSWGY